jgi:hypothetical protein
MIKLSVTRILLGGVAAAALAPTLAAAQIGIQRRVELYQWGVFVPKSAGVTAKAKPAPSGKVVLQGRATSAAAPLKWVDFDIPSDYKGELPKPQQSVYLSADGKIAGFTKFPIQPPEANQCVGRGAGKGCFSMRTMDVKVSNTGLVTGMTKITSDDDIDGFTGNLEILFVEKDGNVVWAQHVGCWGVNVRSGREEAWQFSPPLDSLLQTETVQVFQYQDSCGRDRTKAAFAEMQAGAQAAAPIIQLFVSSSGK